MAKIFRISGYYVDYDEYTYENEQFGKDLVSMIAGDGVFQQFHIEESEWFELDGEEVENCDLALLTRHFKKDNSDVKFDRPLPVAGQKYRHFKIGKIVTIIGISRHTETEEVTVVYDYEGTLWNRPLDMFLAEVGHEKYPNAKQKYRFELVESEDKKMSKFEKVKVQNISVDDWEELIQTKDVREFLPDYETVGSAGMDVCACIKEPITLNPFERVCVPTGLKIELPKNVECQVRPRSGMALKHGITVLNTPGTIDEDYRGEIGVILINLSKDAYTIQDGDRIAQLVFNKVKRVEWVPAIVNNNTERGEGGFGSTGMK